MKTLNQTRQTASFLLIAGLFCSVASVFGQPVRVNIKVNSTVGMQQVQPFEVVPEQKSMSGMTSLTEKSNKLNASGTFIIKGKENSNVIVELNAPDVLTNREKQTMPLNMSLAWHSNTPCNENKLKFNTNKTNTFTFSKAENDPSGKKYQDDDRLGYLYLKGTADVPANSQSPFEGTINLTIEY